MNLIRVAQVLEIGFNTKLPVLLYGHSGFGKTGFAQTTFPHSIIIHNHEIDESLNFLSSVVQNREIIIFENISEKNLQKILLILQSKTMFAKEINNYFIFTSQINFPNLSGILKVEFPKPDKASWIKWAESHNMHPLVMQLTLEKKLLNTYTPKQLELLSTLLHGGVHSELLDLLISSLLGNDLALIADIKAGYDHNINFDTIISLEDSDFIQKIKQTSSENVDKFNHNLLEEIKFDESIISLEKLIAYLTTIDNKKSFELLEGLLNNEESYSYLNDLLKQNEIKVKLDDILGT
jgi:hypothetical protein